MFATPVKSEIFSVDGPQDAFFRTFLVLRESKYEILAQNQTWKRLSDYASLKVRVKKMVPTCPQLVFER